MKPILELPPTLPLRSALLALRTSDSVQRYNELANEAQAAVFAWQAQALGALEAGVPASADVIYGTQMAALAYKCYSGSWEAYRWAAKAWKLS